MSPSVLNTFQTCSTKKISFSSFSPLLVIPQKWKIAARLVHELLWPLALTLQEVVCKDFGSSVVRVGCLIWRDAHILLWTFTFPTFIPGKKEKQIPVSKSKSPPQPRLARGYHGNQQNSISEGHSRKHGGQVSAHSCSASPPLPGEGGGSSVSGAPRTCRPSAGAPSAPPNY